MYIVTHNRPWAVSAFQAKPFRQTFKRGVSAASDGVLQRPNYDIIGADSSPDDPGLVAICPPNRNGASPPRLRPLHACPCRYRWRTARLILPARQRRDHDTPDVGDRDAVPVFRDEI
jgi:hypothetical protein